MIQYFDDYDLACVDGYSFRRDKKTGYYLSSKKIDGRRIRLHVYVWEKEHGKTPKGYAIHHKDENKKNNEIENLVLLKNEDHSVLHGSMLSNEARAAMAKRVTEIAMPKAKEWHSSKNGHDWHREHALKQWENKGTKTYKCMWCGRQFETKHDYAKTSNIFCSNNCKSAYRRASGVDDVTKICERCGNEYRSNKYQKTKYCPNCKNRKNRGRTSI